MQITAFIHETVDVRAILKHIDVPDTPHRPGAGTPGAVRGRYGACHRCRGIYLGNPYAQPPLEYEPDQRAYW